SDQDRDDQLQPEAIEFLIHSGFEGPKTRFEGRKTGLEHCKACIQNGYCHELSITDRHVDCLSNSERLFRWEPALPGENPDSVGLHDFEFATRGSMQAGRISQESSWP